MHPQAGRYPADKRYVTVWLSVTNWLPRIATVLVLASVPVMALDPRKASTQYIQTAWNTNAGLPQSSVHSIAQTKDGYLWLATEQGLARFDGVRFTAFNHRNSKSF